MRACGQEAYHRSYDPHFLDELDLVIEDVLIFNFNENSGAVVHDATPYHNDGTISGAEWVSSLQGTALRFDGHR